MTKPESDPSLSVDSSGKAKGTRPSDDVGVEALLWLMVAILLILADYKAATAWLTLIHVCMLLLLHSGMKIPGMLDLHSQTTAATAARDVFRDEWWRTTPTIKQPVDPQGRFMSVVLAPAVLHAVGLCASSDHQTIPFKLYAQLIASGMLFVWDHKWDRMTLVMGCVMILDEKLQTLRAVLFIGIWQCCYSSLSLAASFRNVFSKGEWIAVSSLLAVVLVEYIMSPTLPLDHGDLYLCVALTGTVGCGLVFALIDFISKTTLVIRLPILLLTPLLTIEAAMFMQPAAQDYYLPRPLVWIVDFLLSQAEPMIQVETTTWPFLADLSRSHVLAYWCVVMVTSLVLAPLSEHTSPILTRKYFHLVAVLLFVPGILLAPKLQSLAFCVALCLLLVAECIRPIVPPLDEFYRRYLDPEKREGEESSTTVVSHMALISGCGGPMWLSGACRLPLELSLMAALTGVAVLGVGDAMGAVVGYPWGRWRWGQGRTVEGSAAMGLSLVACAYLAVGWNLWSLWLPTTVFVTLLEAFTLQIDNIVLPLAGLTVLLLLHSIDL